MFSFHNFADSTKIQLGFWTGWTRDVSEYTHAHIHTNHLYYTLYTIDGDNSEHKSNIYDIYKEYTIFCFLNRLSHLIILLWLQQESDKILCTCFGKHIPYENLTNHHINCEFALCQFMSVNWLNDLVEEKMKWCLFLLVADTFYNKGTWHEIVFRQGKIANNFRKLVNIWNLWITIIHQNNNKIESDRKEPEIWNISIFILRHLKNLQHHYAFCNGFLLKKTNCVI